MDRQEERKSGPMPAERKAEWTPPQVDELVAGAAEGSSDISTDGVDIPS
jgi:hypothetical protein